MKILIVHLTSIDTQKAYAVTISNTGEALKKSAEVEFLGPARLPTAGFGGTFQVKWNRFCKSLWHISKLLRYPLVDKLSILLTRNLIGFIIFFKRKKLNSYCIWTRDLRIALLACKLNLPTLCEVHKSFSQREVSSLYRGTHLQNLVLAPISSYLKAELSQIELIRNQHLRVIELPMGVTSQFLERASLRKPFQTHPDIKIGYFGSMSTMGVSSEIDLFIRNLLMIQEHRFNLLLVGIGKEGKLAIDKLLDGNHVSQTQIIVIERVEHQFVPRLMQECDILLVPYGNDSFNKGRFPVKIVEYAASKIPILCTDTTSNQAILGDGRAWFFSYDNPDSLGLVINKIQQEPDLRIKKVESAYKWATNLTYDSRASKLLCALESIKN
jgi:glycosyltransferase involved in cell wall biosynthesis